jgi:hypothetical protein
MIILCVSVSVRASVFLFEQYSLLKLRHNLFYLIFQVVCSFQTFTLQASSVPLRLVTPTNSLSNLHLLILAFIVTLLVLSSTSCRVRVAIAGLGKLTIAIGNGASEWSTSGVCTHMSLEICIIAKSFSTILQKFAKK